MIQVAERLRAICRGGSLTSVLPKRHDVAKILIMVTSSTQSHTTQTLETRQNCLSGTGRPGSFVRCCRAGGRRHSSLVAQQRDASELGSESGLG